MLSVGTAWFAVANVLLVGVSVPGISQEQAPLPRHLREAQKIYLLNDSGDLKAGDHLYTKLTEWGRFAVVDSREGADVVAVLTQRPDYSYSFTSASGVVIGSLAIGGGVTVSDEKLFLRIFDGGTAELLWADSATKWVTAGHAPGELVKHLRERLAGPQ
ncbi:MAG: hypothetical protein QF634_12760 [Vicinamibacterales bacterium]|jgi:hypothetical protein|nr:hypothetical protein [Acidobacteriota bacterium]MDP6373365.1 hypothetical protein [Vicinamibacterales bacterium]|tara:strand:- start:1830 stop:2306 length:477 start_codon:yes stop_codon:yes gene_type:complete